MENRRIGIDWPENLKNWINEKLENRKKQQKLRKWKNKKLWYKIEKMKNKKSGKCKIKIGELKNWGDGKLKKGTIKNRECEKWKNEKL